MADRASHKQPFSGRRELDQDHRPVVKLFNPMGPATWLLCELDADGDTLFAFCDFGEGEPELGYVSLEELKEISAGLVIGLERDLSFRGTQPISVYARDARAAGWIVELNLGATMYPRR
ncbi:DUF2958 domain-containing protein [Methylobacterium sp. WL120]|uniref:DUF2958 domain-containing protein n=1 Tax=Methylobacterium sp. WL120 TaxID=2603887 RepID=UPI001650A30A|nr:DUF2958 domain-containing protein [Methylobacterium sp. WL120]